MRKLTNSCLLLTLLAACIGFVILFLVLENLLGVKLLDKILTLSESNLVLQSMSDSRRNAHIWITLILDTLFPVVYGLLLIGTTMKLYSNQTLGWIAPALILVAVDLIENMVHVLALLSHEPVLVFKRFLVPAKWLLTAVAVVIIVIPGLKRLVNSIKQNFFTENIIIRSAVTQTSFIVCEVGLLTLSGSPLLFFYLYRRLCPALS